MLVTDQRGKLSSTPCVHKYFLFRGSVEILKSDHWDFKCVFFKSAKLNHMLQPFYFIRRNPIWQITEMAPQLMTFFCEGVLATLRYTWAVRNIAQWVNNLKVAAEMSEWKQLFLPTSLMCAKPSCHQSSLKPSPKIVFPVKCQLENISNSSPLIHVSKAYFVVACVYHTSVAVTLLWNRKVPQCWPLGGCKSE